MNESFSSIMSVSYYLDNNSQHEGRLVDSSNHCIYMANPSANIVSNQTRLARPVFQGAGSSDRGVTLVSLF